MTKADLLVIADRLMCLHQGTDKTCSEAADALVWCAEEIERLREVVANAPRPLIMGAGKVHTVKFDTSDQGSAEIDADGRARIRQPWWLYARIQNGDALRIIQGTPPRWFINDVEQFAPPPQAESISDA